MTTHQESPEVIKALSVLGEKTKLSESCLSNPSDYMFWMFDSKGITLDGKFDIEQLEAIVVIMKAKIQ